ncbi:hypothetical protein [Candidatus Stoquefichus massiliensis]|uniref:hypothetical protein n=1 Tax=Candidatus Stoquefichus massiliensis TaxID=1470350 RepID=UPI000482D344|nr:hypothetical protein [Candidatus Stoquefichus massiliensis]
MKIIACVDNQMGMMFNHRRQSQDRNVRKKILKITNCLFMNKYSSALWKNDILVTMESEKFLMLASVDDYCFVENVLLKEYQDEIDEIILFCWNREYPADFYLDIDLSCFHLVNQEDFAGSSHDIITQKIYRRD